MTQPRVIRDPGEMRQLSSRQRPPSAVVMTMGGLHAAHATLMDIARDRVGPTGRVVVTIFVNPLQFAANEDLDAYPRTFAADLELCADHGVDVVFAPSPSQMYPEGEPAVTVDPGELGQLYEGVARPTHFRGVLTVVSILLNLTAPDYAIFGEKDYQQLTLIQAMVRDLRLPVEIVPAPIGREPSGLAMSSRNRYLSARARKTALRLPAAVEAGVAAGQAGVASVIDAANAKLQAPKPEVPIDVQYVTVTSPDMGPPPEFGPARLIITAIVDGTRLLDNSAVQLGGGGS